MLIALTSIILCLCVSPVLADDFLLTSNGSVADLSSGLVWQGSSRQILSGDKAAEHCAAIETAGDYLWRLPTYAEISDLEQQLQAFSPSLYWVNREISLSEGIYCFGDGAYFPSIRDLTPALARCVSENPLAAPFEAVKVWANYWQQGNIEGYLSAYMDNFQPREDISHDAWVQSRRQRLAAAGEISIDLHTERLDTFNDQVVEIVFLQEYRSRNYQDRVRKRLLLSFVQGRWVISREEQLSYLHQQTFSAAYKE